LFRTKCVKCKWAFKAVEPNGRVTNIVCVHPKSLRYPQAYSENNPYIHYDWQHSLSNLYDLKCDIPFFKMGRAKENKSL